MASIRVLIRVSIRPHSRSGIHDAIHEKGSQGISYYLDTRLVSCFWYDEIGSWGILITKRDPKIVLVMI